MSSKCPKCDAELEDGVTVCPKCGNVITIVSAEERDKKLKELAALLEIEEEAEPKVSEGPSSIQAKKENGKIGLTNGRVNGLSERRGLTNGRRGGTARGEFGERKTRVIALGVIILLLLSILIIFLAMPRPTGKISIDGNFSDWADVEKTKVSSSAAVDSIAPVELATYSDEKTVSFYVKVRGSIFSGAPQSMERITDGFYILIDSDKNPETGYSSLGYGFDYRITIYGEGGNIRSSNIFRYESTDNSLNWSAWKLIGSVKAASAGAEVELQVSKSVASLGEDFAAILITKSWNGIEAEPFPFSMHGTYIEVRVTPMAQLLLNDSSDFLKIEMCAKGGEAFLKSISFSVLGNARNYTATLSSGDKEIGKAIIEKEILTINTDSNNKLTKDAISTLILSGNLSGVEPGRTAGFKIDSPFRINASAPVILLYEGNAEGNFIGYYREIPDGLSIDGAFGEWQEAIKDIVKVKNPNVDVSEYALKLGATLGMYVGVEGRIFNGEPIAEQTPVISTGGGGQPQEKYVSGEDVLRIYLYTSLSYTNPDYMVEIRGIDNNITSAVFYTSVNGSWVQMQSVNAKLSYRQVELEIPNVVKNIFFYADIEFKDWNSSSVSRLVLSSSVGENVEILAILPVVPIAVWIVNRRREHD